MYGSDPDMQESLQLYYNWKGKIRYSDMRLSSTYFYVGLHEILCQDIPSIIIFKVSI